MENKENKIENSIVSNGTRKIVILKHGGGELANQLWNYLSIYAFGLESKTPVINPSFYEYHYFFRFLKSESWITKTTSKLLFRTPRRRNSFINRNQRFKYAQRAWFTAKLHSKCIFSSENTMNTISYLPPTTPLPNKFENCTKIYFTGWLFRNPIGLTKFRNELVDAFKPTEKIEQRVNLIISELKQKYEKIIGVHIRQADYKTFKDGKYFIEQGRAREIINEYVIAYGLNLEKTVFLIASDGKIEGRMFTGLNTYISKENSIIDLFLLSKTSVIIGSDSSFGAFAAWYGNITHVVMKKELIDWNYYDGNKYFFENKYSNLTHF